VSRRHAKRDAGVPDLAFRADQALRHRRLGNEEGPRDLLSGQPAERSKRERDLGIESERRMAAGEDELQPLVGNGRLIHIVLRSFRHLELADLGRQRAIAADAVDRPVACGGHEPGARIRRGAVPRPALGGGGERVLGGLLGELEVAEEADQCREDASPLVAKDLVENR
jgi:hypothetical protein